MILSTLPELNHRTAKSLKHKWLEFRKEATASAGVGAGGDDDFGESYFAQRPSTTAASVASTAWVAPAVASRQHEEAQRNPIRHAPAGPVVGDGGAYNVLTGNVAGQQQPGWDDSGVHK